MSISKGVKKESAEEAEQYVEALFGTAQPMNSKQEQCIERYNNPYVTFLGESQRDQQASKSGNKDKSGFFDIICVNIGCPMKLILKVFRSITKLASGETHIIVVNEHSTGCKKLAGQGSIPQSINPELRRMLPEWISAHSCCFNP